MVVFMKMKNNTGFTLVELLAVIVILAVIILIASSNVGTIMTNARKNALAMEGNTLINSAKQAYQIAILNGKVTGTDSVCFSLEDLKNNGYFEKSDDKYKGSVLISPDSAGKVISYTFWISNGSYYVTGPTGTTGSAAEPVNTAENKDASVNCGGKTLTNVE